MSQNLHVDSFKWVENTSQFNKGFIENYNKGNDKGYFFKFTFNILKSYMNFTPIYHFNQKNLWNKKHNAFTEEVAILDWVLPAMIKAYAQSTQ